MHARKDVEVKLSVCKRGSERLAARESSSRNINKDLCIHTFLHTRIRNEEGGLCWPLQQQQQQGGTIATIALAAAAETRHEDIQQCQSTAEAQLIRVRLLENASARARLCVRLYMHMYVCKGRERPSAAYIYMYTHTVTVARWWLHWHASSWLASSSLQCERERASVPRDRCSPARARLLRFKESADVAQLSRGIFPRVRMRMRRLFCAAEAKWCRSVLRNFMLRVRIFLVFRGCPRCFITVRSSC